MIIAVFFAIVWAIAIGLLSGVIVTRSSYVKLSNEHWQMQQRIDQGEVDVRSESGDSLSDIFEYKSNAMQDYLNALETFLLLGLLPSIGILIAAIGTTIAGALRQQPAQTK
jgi:hypothetical protein